MYEQINVTRTSKECTEIMERLPNRDTRAKRVFKYFTLSSIFSGVFQ